MNFFLECSDQRIEFFLLDFKFKFDPFAQFFFSIFFDQRIEFFLARFQIQVRSVCTIFFLNLFDQRIENSRYKEDSVDIVSVDKKQNHLVRNIFFEI